MGLEAGSQHRSKGPIQETGLQAGLGAEEGMLAA